MVLVAEDTSLSAPPITPASACARASSAITSISASSFRCWPSSVFSASPFCASRTSQVPAREPVQVERVHRVPQLEQHVVGDVDDVVD